VIRLPLLLLLLRPLQHDLIDLRPHIPVIRPAGPDDPEEDPRLERVGCEGVGEEVGDRVWVGPEPGGKEEDGSEDERKKTRSRSRSESEQPVARKPRARADLAFLDDEEESD